MKFLSVMSLVLGLSLSSLPASASENFIQLVSDQAIANTVRSAAADHLLDWRVGDTMNYDISVAVFGKMGTMVKAVTSEEGANAWIKQTIHLQSQNEVIDMLINRDNGQILKLLRNGVEQEIPNQNLEIISQERVDITVPAGKFHALYIKAKTADVKELEVWLNPDESVLDGTLKQIADTGFLKMTMELTSFVKVPR